MTSRIAPGAVREQTGLWFGIGLLLLLLPLWLNPWADLPFEPAKAALLRGGVLLLGLLTCGALLFLPQMRSSATARLGRIWPLVGVVMLYGLVFSLAGLLSVDPQRSFWGGSDRHGVVTLWSQIGLFLLLVIAVGDMADREQMTRWLLLASLPVCLYGLAQAVGLDPLLWGSDSVSPVLATLGRSNFLGAWLAVLLPLSLHNLHRIWLHRKRAPRQASGAVLLVIVQLLCLLLTLARAGWLAAVAGGLVFYWFAPIPFSSSLLRYRSGLLAGALLLFVAFFLLGEGIGRAQLLSHSALPENASPSAPPTADEFTAAREASPSRRLIIWRATWPLIAERPLLGYGPETFVLVFNARYPPGSLYDGTDVLVDDPHNQLLEHLMAAGVLGAASWLLFWGFILWKIWLRVRRATGAEKLLATACLGGAGGLWGAIPVEPGCGGGFDAFLGAGWVRKRRGKVSRRPE